MSSRQWASPPAFHLERAKVMSIFVFSHHCSDCSLWFRWIKVQGACMVHKCINKETWAVLLCLWRNYRSDWHWSATIISTHSLIMVILLKEKQSNTAVFYLEMNDLSTCPVTDHISSKNTHTHTRTDIHCMFYVLWWSGSDRLCVCSLKQPPAEIWWCLNLWMKRTDRMINRQESKWHTHAHTSWQPTVYIHIRWHVSIHSTPTPILVWIHRCLYTHTHTFSDSFAHIHSHLHRPISTLKHFLTHTFVLPAVRFALVVVFSGQSYVGQRSLWIFIWPTAMQLTPQHCNTLWVHMKRWIGGNSRPILSIWVVTSFLSTFLYCFQQYKIRQADFGWMCLKWIIFPFPYFHISLSLNKPLMKSWNKLI